MLARKSLIAMSTTAFASDGSNALSFSMRPTSPVTLSVTVSEIAMHFSVGCMPAGVRMKSSSSKWSRNCFSLWLTADGETLSCSAASVTLRFWINALSVLKKFRSTVWTFFCMSGTCSSSLLVSINSRNPATVEDPRIYGRPCGHQQQRRHPITRSQQRRAVNVAVAENIKAASTEIDRKDLLSAVNDA